MANRSGSAGAMVQEYLGRCLLYLKSRTVHLRAVDLCPVCSPSNLHMAISAALRLIKAFLCNHLSVRKLQTPMRLPSRTKPYPHLDLSNSSGPPNTSLALRTQSSA